MRGVVFMQSCAPVSTSHNLHDTQARPYNALHVAPLPVSGLGRGRPDGGVAGTGAEPCLVRIERQRGDVEVVALEAAQRSGGVARPVADGEVAPRGEGAAAARRVDRGVDAAAMALPAPHLPADHVAQRRCEQQWARGERTTELCAQSYSTHVPSSPQLSTSLQLPPAATPFTMSLWTMGVGVAMAALSAPLGRWTAGGCSAST